MAKDPAFLFYPGDAAEDVSHMNRLERGAYFDFVQAQKKFGPLTITMVRKILGKDFDLVWDALKMCLTYEKDMYFIHWLQDSIEKRKKYSASRANNRKGQNTSKKEVFDSTYVNHMENGNENRNVNDNTKGVQGETEKPDLKVYQEWIAQIENGTDLYWPKMSRDKNLKLTTEQLQDLCTRYIGLLSEYERKRPPDQHAFRLAFLSYCVENKPNNNNGKHNSTNNSSVSTRTFSGKYEQSL